jgi:hypothetical protein
MVHKEKYAEVQKKKGFYFQDKKNEGKDTDVTLKIQQQQAAPLSLPQLNRLLEASFARDESSASTAVVPAIPSQFKVTHQILLHW